eukprot:3470596-Rhodomonas_salina.1
MTPRPHNAPVPRVPGYRVPGVPGVPRSPGPVIVTVAETTRYPGTQGGRKGLLSIRTRVRPLLAPQIRQIQHDNGSSKVREQIQKVSNLKSVTTQTLTGMLNVSHLAKYHFWPKFWDCSNSQQRFSLYLSTDSGSLTLSWCILSFSNLRLTLPLPVPESLGYWSPTESYEFLGTVCMRMSALTTVAKTEQVTLSEISGYPGMHSSMAAASVTAWGTFRGRKMSKIALPILSEYSLPGHPPVAWNFKFYEDFLEARTCCARRYLCSKKRVQQKRENHFFRLRKFRRLRETTGISLFESQGA